MKKLLLAGCLFAVVSHCHGTAVEPSNNAQSNDVKKNIEEYFAKGTRYYIIAKKMQQAAHELSKARKDPNYRITPGSQKVLKENNLLNSDGSFVEENVYVVFEETRNKFDDPEFVSSFFARHNID